MNRTTLVFAAVMASLSSGFAVDITSTNLVGLDGLPGATTVSIVNQNGPHTVTNSTVTGGNALSVTDAADTDIGFGGTAMRVRLAGVAITNRTILIQSSVLQGGQGSAISIAGSLIEVASAYGGDGIATVRGEIYSTDSEFYGGDGGTFFALGGAFAANVAGGAGISVNNGSLSLTNGYAEGGAGGTVFTPGVSSAPANGGTAVVLFSSPLGSSISGSELVGGNGGTSENENGLATADGGAGLSISDVTGSVVISNSVLTGGNGGIASGTALSTANGGAGLFLANVPNVKIINTTLTGGTNGVANGVDGLDGASIVIQASSVDLVGGKLVGELLFSGTGTSAITLQGTTMGTVRQTGGIVNVNDWDAIHFQKTLISAGTMNFNGPMFNLQNNSLFTLGGTTAEARFNGGLTVQSGGVLNAGLGTVRTGSLTVQNGGRFDTASGALFADDLTVQSGGVFDAGLGTVTGSDMVFQTGSKGITGFDGTTSGLLVDTGNFTIESGVQWTIDVGTNAVVSGTVVDIATAAGTLNADITADDLTFIGAGFVKTWLDVFGLENDAGVLTASYTQQAIDEGLGVAGDTSEYGKAVADFSDLVKPGTPAFDVIAALSGPEEGGVLLSNSYVRTAEIASSLIGLQAVFADQVNQRIRSHMQYEGVGFPASYSPEGALGWDAMRSFSDRLESGSGDALRSLSDRLESGISTDGMRSFSDRLESGISTDGIRSYSDSVEDRFGYDEIEGLVGSVTPDVAVEEITLPFEWQIWGGGYGSYIDQDTTTDFAGYEATLAGGILGIDKRINNVLFGVGGGYARTVLQGYQSKDARADTLHGVAYFSAHGDRAWLDAGANYAFNTVDTDYDVLGYSGDFDAHTIGLNIGGGLAFHLMDVAVLSPEVSILNTLYVRDAYTESSSIGGMPDLQWEDYDQWSHLAKVGATLSSVQKINLADLEVHCRPQVRAHWLHEFNAEMDNETYMMAGGSNIIGASLTAREEDLIKVGGGLFLSKWSSDATEFGFDIDGIFGDNYSAYIVSGKIIHRF